MATTATPTDRSDTLVERLFDATIGTLELYSVHVGRALGLYEVLADGRSRTTAELADEATVAERYAREWLEQQAVAGFLEVDDVQAEAHLRRYRLPTEHARVLAHAEDPAHVAPFAAMVAGIGQALPDVVAAYRSGAGVRYERYGDDFREGQGGINRPAFTVDLVESWLPALPDVHQRLVDGARVADVGCGLGWSTQAIARAYPATEVVGIDADEASVRDAAALLDPALRDRVRFVRDDARTAEPTGPFDLVVVLETLHDIPDPTAALTTMHRWLTTDGVVLVADERVAERFVAPGDAVERMMFGWSAVHCLPAAMADGDHTAVGTAIRPATVAAFAAAAGYARCEVLPIDNELFRFYRLDA